MKIFKKTLMLFMILTLMPFCTYAEEEQKEIEGLHEALSSLFIENCFTPEEIDEMNQKHVEWYDNWLTTEYIPGWKWLHPSKTDEEAEELYQKMKDEAVLDFSKGFRVCPIDFNTYVHSFANAGKLYYLFSDLEYWEVFDNTKRGRAEYNLDGELISLSYLSIRLQDDGIAFLRNEEKINELLMSAGETAVSDVRITSWAGFAILYLRCSEREYMISLSDRINYDGYIDTINPMFLYDAKVFSSICEDAWEKRAKTYSTSIKPTFETEAQSLQAEGLLYGNENGLDLLKPLTRIEAAAMLLRALGESETAENGVQVFSDVPDTHWGFGAAANAHALGLIYGIGDNLFAPDRRVTAEEFSTMVLRAAGENEFDWQNALNILIERNIITKEDSLTMDFFTRGDMAKIIYEIKANGLF